MGNHALVFGATGIQGWAVINELLRGHPTPESFDRITALTNRPAPGELLWPSSPKLQLISGINILTDKGQEGLENDLKDRVPSIETVSHVFFFAYILKQDPADEIKTNVDLLKRAVTAIEYLSKDNLKFVVLPTGTKAYGVHCIAEFTFADKLPLSEDLPRIPEPWRSQNFYYYQTDWLEAQSQGKPWTFYELRPDVVVGFVPNKNPHCLAETLATYLACFREVEGEGAECIFPGTEGSWEIMSDDSGQDEIARFAIHAALHPETCGQGRALNVASNSKPMSWAEKWPVICEFFGLKGTPAPAGGTGPQPGEYLIQHESVWREMKAKYGLLVGRAMDAGGLAGFQYFIMTLFDFDRHLDLTKQHKAWRAGGTVEEATSKEVWTAFQIFRDAKIIP